MPTMFISYSWDSTEHKAWVRRLAEDIQAHGVTVWLDQFEVRLGDDVTQFMERGVGEADCVLLICTENFGRKVHERLGGVGYEQSIVTSEILNKAPVRGRFVCLLRQGLPSQALPTYMHSRLWLDCREDVAYPEAVRQLVDHLLMLDSAAAVASVPSTTAPPVPVAPERPPTRWVLVAGTGAKRGYTAGLEELSRALGERLALAECGLVTGGWPGVDEWTARSFARAVHARQWALEDALIQVIVKTDEPAFTAGQLVFVDKGTAEYDEPIRHAHAVILLGGLGGTQELGQRALKLRKPVLPIADTGGDAKSMYLQMLKTWNELGWMGLAEKQFQRLGRPAAVAIEAAVDIARAIRQ